MSDERLLLVLRYCYPERTWERDLRFSHRRQSWELRPIRGL